MYLEQSEIPPMIQESVEEYYNMDEVPITDSKKRLENGILFES
jgi:hypothetical protein